MTDCIEVTSSRTPKGYGHSNVNVGGRVYAIYAHRMVWEMKHGPIPAGMLVCHTCDNPGCVNVEHLFLGTNGDNLRDMVSKGRSAQQRKTHCINGHEFTEENTRLNARGRECRTCDRERHKRRYRLVRRDSRTVVRSAS